VTLRTEAIQSGVAHAASFVPIAEVPLPQTSEISRQLTSISNLLDLDDSRIALTGASLSYPSVRHMKIAVKGGNVIEAVFLSPRLY
jgi:hypothetical protein